MILFWLHFGNMILRVHVIYCHRTASLMLSGSGLLLIALCFRGLGSWIEIVEERTGDIRNPPRRYDSIFQASSVLEELTRKRSRRGSTSRPGGGGGSLMAMIGAQADSSPSRPGQPTQHDDGREQRTSPCYSCSGPQC